MWLDRVLDGPQRDRPVVVWLARAEAARWREDAPAAERARTRAAALQALASSDARAVLAAAAHLR